MVSPRIKKCTLLMTSHYVVDPENQLPFGTGVHYGGSLVVVSGQEGDSMIQVPEILDLLWDKEVENAFVYLAGFSASVLCSPDKKRKIEMTMSFLKVVTDCVENERIHLVGCSCCWELKKNFAESRGLELLSSECGGSPIFEKIVEDIRRKAAV